MTPERWEHVKQVVTGVARDAAPWRLRRLFLELLVGMETWAPMAVAVAGAKKWAVEREVTLDDAGSVQ